MLIGKVYINIFKLFIWIIVTSFFLAAIRLLCLPFSFYSTTASNFSELLVWALQGFRFDLKATSCVAVLIAPLFIIISNKLKWYFLALISFLFILLAAINYHYLSFYKTPISSIVFGVFEDDTLATLKTIWIDFNVPLSLVLIGFASYLILFLYQALEQVLLVPSSKVFQLLIILVLLFLILFFAKGTLRSIALQKQHTTITRSSFLNDRVINGPMAFYYAWQDRKMDQQLLFPTQGLNRWGFTSPIEAGKVLSSSIKDEADLKTYLLQAPQVPQVPASDKNKNLVFFLMESWSAEPLRYQSKDFNVAAQLEPWLAKACHFDNFDSLQPGTHPSLEALLFSTPITPLTQGPAGKMNMPWSVAQLYKNAGYSTIFLTSGRSGWRNLNQVLHQQGFDEVIDASDLMHLYPEAKLNVWGVWDEYIAQYLKSRLSSVSQKPLFIFVLTTTNHPPYEYPNEHQKIVRNMKPWSTTDASKELEANLDTYTYANDVLGKFLNEFQSNPQFSNTLIAATGDHNMRTLGSYSEKDRQLLSSQVPFMIWNTNQKCTNDRHLPAHHGDVFPTLLPLMGIEKGFLSTGRNLFQKMESEQLNNAYAVQYSGQIRNKEARWGLGQASSYTCYQGGDKSCRYDDAIDRQARAKIALSDWYIRSFFSERLNQ